MIYQSVSAVNGPGPNSGWSGLTTCSKVIEVLIFDVHDDKDGIEIDDGGEEREAR